jgi:hypothetical protein
MALATAAALFMFAAQGGAPAVAATPPDADRLVCRRVQVTGSNLPGRKHCLTRQQWLAMRDQTGKAADSFLYRSRRGPDAIQMPD